MDDLINLTVCAATYDGVDSAEADYDAVKSMYKDLDLMDTFDAV
ncbi:hypothetical protein [Allorhodopirellula solitaria]|uniref:Uncharacterized protein n=1 Tax=Allorhodopirellula solitaria TaxID=2527987 RepID=A0A5C5XX77_9BACT|nr:hypothetical protein [Allorhodopirellula solitaria]TWT66505.1 hypothetical protein CA85_26010 [Allorhodopirellula solitaria]